MPWTGFSLLLNYNLVGPDGRQGGGDAFQGGRPGGQAVGLGPQAGCGPVPGPPGGGPGASGAKGLRHHRFLPPGKRYPARVAYISAKTVEIQKERVTLVYCTKIRAENPGHELKPSMPGEAVIPLETQNIAAPGQPAAHAKP